MGMMQHIPLFASRLAKLSLTTDRPAVNRGSWAHCEVFISTEVIPSAAYINSTGDASRSIRAVGDFRAEHPNESEDGMISFRLAQTWTMYVAQNSRWNKSAEFSGMKAQTIYAVHKYVK
jgi:hypothetical protein